MAEDEPAPDLRGGRVLVVDDLEPNRELLKALLAPDGVVVDEAEDGVQALERVAEAPPDLVLLDIQMPRMDGIEACRRLKADPATATIPVLLVTALADRHHRLEGMRAGANDFVTKPVDGTDLLLRVRNSLRMRSLYAQVDRQLSQLKRLEALRDDLVHMMVHDLRSPLSSLSVTLQLASGAVVDPGVQDDLSAAGRAVRRMADMVSDILDISRMEAAELPLNRSHVDLPRVCEAAVDAIADAASRERIEYRWPPESTTVLADRKVLTRVVANLVDNALKFGPIGDTILIEAERRGSSLRLSVVDRGPGVPERARQHIFDKFRQAESDAHDRRSSGLGLAFCKLAVEAHGGAIGVESAAGGGSRFWLDLPAQDA